jgi:uncharacterized protein YgbK (DUF1537 family)
MGFTTNASRQGYSKLSVMIIADDLSGATDSAVACAERGLETVVVLGETSDPGTAEAIAFDADTRRLTSDAAAAKRPALSALTRKRVPVCCSRKSIPRCGAMSVRKLPQR